MSEVIYRANIRIVRDRGARRRAHLPAGVTVTFGVHGAIAEHYGVEGREEHPTTLDHVMAAGGALMYLPAQVAGFGFPNVHRPGPSFRHGRNP